jgi:transcriptional repressor NrdR
MADTVTIFSCPVRENSRFFRLSLAVFGVGSSGHARISPGQTSAMKCPFCGFENDKVVDSRESKEADSIRRRRECLKCGKRFTTYERIDEIPYMVVKKDGRREKFDRQKVLNGLLRACEKRPVPISKLEQIVNEAESFVIESAERERKTSELGELIMNRLRKYDKVAYVRFASVYLDFKDVKEFMNELKDLVKAKTG